MRTVPVRVFGDNFVGPLPNLRSDCIGSYITFRANQFWVLSTILSRSNVVYEPPSETPQTVGLGLGEYYSRHNNVFRNSYNFGFSQT